MSQNVNSKAYDIMLSALLSHNVAEIDVAKARQIKDAVFVDSRSSREFAVSHIVDAIWVGYDTTDFSGLEKISKDSEIIVYCSVGYRSEKIADSLKKQGFKNVYNLYGGIFEWVNQGESVVDSERKSTNKVHAYSRIWGVWLDKGEKVY